MFRNRMIGLLFVCSAMLPAFAQTECKDALYQAGRDYEAGNLKTCIITLEQCMIALNTSEMKAEAYRLLALAYLNLNDKERSAVYAEKLLKLRPDYQIYSDIDPVEFRRLMDEFKVEPSWLLGFDFGVNLSGVALKKSYSAFNSPQRYSISPGYMAGINLNYNIPKGFSARFDISTGSADISHEVDTAGLWQQNYDERQQYIGTSLSGYYSLKILKKLSIDPGIGFGYNYVYSSYVNFEAINLITASIQQSTQNVKEVRTLHQPYLMGRLGVTTELRRGSLGIEGSWMYFLRNTFEPADRMALPEFNLINQYVNDDVSLRVGSICFIYRLPLIYRISK